MKHLSIIIRSIRASAAGIIAHVLAYLSKQVFHPPCGSLYGLEPVGKVTAMLMQKIGCAERVLSPNGFNILGRMAASLRRSTIGNGVSQAAFGIVLFRHFVQYRLRWLKVKDGLGISVHGEAGKIPEPGHRLESCPNPETLPISTRILDVVVILPQMVALVRCDGYQ